MLRSMIVDGAKVCAWSLGPKTWLVVLKVWSQESAASSTGKLFKNANHNPPHGDPMNQEL